MSSKVAFFVLLLAAILIGTSPSSATRAKYDDPDAGQIRMVRAEEIREMPASSTFYNYDGSVVNSGYQHVLKLTFKFMSANEVSTDGGLGSAGDVSSTGGVVSSNGGQLEPGTTGATTTTGTTSTTGTTGSTGSQVTTGSTGSTDHYYLYINNSHGFGKIPTASSRVPEVTDSYHIAEGIPAGLRMEIKPGEEVPVLYTNTNPLAAGSITATIEHYFPAVNDDPLTPENEAHAAVSNFQKVVYDISKHICGDASIDTRKVHGQPNAEGELPGDPNADPRNTNFGNYVFHGGLFVGNVHWTTWDQSGLARIQLYPLAASSHTSPRLVALTMFAMGNPSNHTENVTLGAYTPSSVNTSIGESNVTWDTRWSSIQPRTSPGSPRDPAQDPIYRIGIQGAGPSNEYMNWQLTTVTPTTASTFTSAMNYLCIALHGESNYTNPTDPMNAWRYFASKEYQDSSASFPRNDCAPRLWIVDIYSTYNWTKNW